MNNVTLFHRWAHQVKPSGKSGNVGKDGTLRAGCHTISFEEIDKFATERGWGWKDYGVFGFTGTDTGPDQF